MPKLDKAIIAALDNADKASSAFKDAVAQLAGYAKENLSKLDSTIDNAKYYDYLNTELTLTFTKTHYDVISLAHVAFIKVTFELSVGSTNLDFKCLDTMLREGELDDKGQQIWHTWGIAQQVANKFHRVAHTTKEEQLAGKKFKVIPRENEKQYIELEVVGLA